MILRMRRKYESRIGGKSVVQSSKRKKAWSIKKSMGPGETGMISDRRHS